MSSTLKGLFQTSLQFSPASTNCALVVNPFLVLVITGSVAAEVKYFDKYWTSYVLHCGSAWMIFSFFRWLCNGVIFGSFPVWCKSLREEVYKLQFYEKKKGQLLILHDSSLSFCIFPARPFKLAIYKFIFSMLSGDKDSNWPAYFHSVCREAI